MAAIKKPLTTGQQQQIADRKAVFEDLKALYAETFGDEKGAPKAKFLAVGPLVAFMKAAREEAVGGVNRGPAKTAYNDALLDVISHNMGRKFNKNAGKVSVSAASPAPPNVAAAGVASKAYTNSLAAAAAATNTGTAMNALQRAMNALRLNVPPTAAAAPKKRTKKVRMRSRSGSKGKTTKRSTSRSRSKGKTAKVASRSRSRSRSGSRSGSKGKTAKAAASPNAATKHRLAAQAPMKAARANLKTAAGVPVPLQIAARLPKKLAGMNAGAANALRSRIIEGLRAGRGKPDQVNSFVIELGLATGEEVAARKAKVAANRTRKATRTAAAKA